MPKFSYVIKDNAGKAYKNVVESSSQAALVDMLQKQGYFIVSIKELSGAGTQRQLNKKKKKRFTHRKIKLT
ncbi:MAG: hypothetical protein KC618_09250, partial [Candidatus Omnitrophica bacterium]|nr:hypothetical protein [Candidatus Omnitrophota bacterium]